MALDVNLILLIVEIVLLVPTLLLLILGRREERGRRQLLSHITNMAKMVSRQEYFNSVHASMQRATHSVKGSITGSAPKSKEEGELVTSIVEEIRAAVKRGVSVQYLVPRSQDRLRVASSYRQAGAEIKFHPGLVVSDIRFIIVDEKSVVLGIPGASGQNQPTREGFLIPSEGLSGILLAQFEGNFSSAMDYDAYVGSVLEDVKRHNPNVSEKLLSSQLQISEEELRRVGQKNLVTRNLPPKEAE